MGHRSVRIGIDAGGIRDQFRGRYRTGESPLLAIRGRRPDGITARPQQAHIGILTALGKANLVRTRGDHVTHRGGIIVQSTNLQQAPLRHIRGRTGGRPAELQRVLLHRHLYAAGSVSVSSRGVGSFQPALPVRLSGNRTVTPDGNNRRLCRTTRRSISLDGSGTCHVITGYRSSAVAPESHRGRCLLIDINTALVQRESQAVFNSCKSHCIGRFHHSANLITHHQGHTSGSRGCHRHGSAAGDTQVRLSGRGKTPFEGTACIGLPIFGGAGRVCLCGLFAHNKVCPRRCDGDGIIRVGDG